MLSDVSPPTEPSVSRIPARTRRQAMDWGLVLASQSIDATIEEPREGGWALVVATDDYEGAVNVIKQYRRENLGWPWRQPVSQSGLLFDWASVAWVALTVIFFWLSRTRGGLVDVGIANGAAVARGEWWRLFTATLLHADLAHLATNAAFGLLLLGLAMGRFGTGVGLLAALVAGAGGNVASCIIHSGNFRGLGASGVVMGALGLLAAQSVGILKYNRRAWRLAAGGVAGGIMLFTILGLSPGTDVVAHAGGLIAGIMIGAMLSLSDKLPTNRSANWVAGCLFAALLGASWLLALRAGPGS